jgi:uncharacterized membrane protein YwzB
MLIVFDCYNIELKVTRVKWWAMKNINTRSFIPKVAHSQVTLKHWVVRPIVIQDIAEGN